MFVLNKKGEFIHNGFYAQVEDYKELKTLYISLWREVLFYRYIEEEEIYSILKEVYQDAISGKYDKGGELEDEIY